MNLYPVRERIRAYRTFRNLNQADVAAQLEVDERTYQNNETGRSELSLRRFLELARIFNVCPSILLEDFLIKEQDPNTVSPFSSQPPLSSKQPRQITAQSEQGAAIALAQLHKEIEMLRLKVEEQKAEIEFLREMCRSR